MNEVICEKCGNSEATSVWVPAGDLRTAAHDVEMDLCADCAESESARPRT